MGRDDKGRPRKNNKIKIPMPIKDANTNEHTIGTNEPTISFTVKQKNCVKR
jgi:hypothetical protein